MSTPVLDVTAVPARERGVVQAQTEPPRAARLAVLSMFLVLGIGGANWMVRIPAVRDRLDLSSSALGLALLGAPAGALVAMPLAGWLVSRAGSRYVTWVSVVAFCAALPLLALAPHVVLLGAALFLFGASMGAMDVGMNAQGVAVEARYGRSLMSSFHAAFSIGSIAGSLTGGLAAWAGVGVRPHLALVALVLGAGALVIPRWLLPASVDQLGDDDPPFALRIPRAVVVLGVIGFCALLAEGAMADWTAVYLRDVVGTGAGVAATGYAVFSLGMSLGRLSGDRVMDRVGAREIVRYGGLVATVGLAVALALDVPLVTAAGFGLVGIGLSVIVPIVFGTAGKLPDVPPGQGIAAVTTLSYLGFLTGPGLIGLLADATSLRASLALVVGLLVGMTLLAGAIRRA